MKSLLRETKIWELESEDMVEDILAEAVAEGGEITKKVVEIKQKKQKGEVVAERYKLTVQVDFAGMFEDYA